MRYKRLTSFSLLSLVILFSATLTSAEPNTPRFDESNPGRPIFDSRQMVPYYDDGLDHADPVPFVPSILPWSKVVLQSYRDNNWEIYRGNDDGSGQQRLTNLDAADINPNFNRGATRIVFASTREGGTLDYDLYLMNGDGSGVVQLTYTVEDDWNPVYSPDGSKIAFQSVVNGQSDVFIINTNGTGLVNLTNHPDYDGAPSWSPDGTKLAFVSRRTGGYRIYSMNANGTNVVKLSDQPYSNNPAWSPDGQRIAYDADGYGGSSIPWQEIWVMNANGTEQTMLFNPGSEIDASVNGWSPDGTYITFTQVYYVVIQGTLYWTNAVAKGLRWFEPGYHIALSPIALDWEPHWQTTDSQPPQSAVNPLPSQSPFPILVTWSGSDNGPAGVRMYDVQVKQGQNGVWTNWLVQTPSSSGYYTNGIGGETYYFRSRAWDNAHNIEPWSAVPDAFTTIESAPPVSAVSPPPPYTRVGGRGFYIYWDGFDPGSSGILNYDIQYRIGNGSWNNLFSETTLLSGLVNFVNFGQSVYFRSRARDTAQNLEAWPGGNGDAQTILYNWGVRGAVRDNGHAPIVGANATTNPAAVGNIPSNFEGQFGAFVADLSTNFSVNVQKNGYGTLPAATFPGKFDAGMEIVLPPTDDLINDGGFESGVLGGPWLVGGGALPASVAQDEGHTGNYHLRLGTVPPQFAEPYNIADPSGNGIHGPRIIGREDGRIYFFWIESGGLTYRWRLPDGSWSTIQQIGTEGIFDSVPQVILDSQGNIHAMWQGGPYYYYARLNANNTWTSVDIVDNYPDAGQDRDAIMQLDAQNRPHVVWRDVAQEYFEHTYRLSNGSWTTPVPTPVIPDEPTYFQMALDGRGNPHIIWLNFRSEGVYYTYLDGSSWTAPTLLTDSGEDGYSPIAVADGQGGIYLMWTVNEPANRAGNYFRHWTEETGLTPSQQAVFGNQFGSISDVFVGSDGSLNVVWNGADLKLYYAKRDPYGFWSSPESFGTITYQFEDMKLAVDENGRPHIVWVTDEFLPENNRLYYRYQKTNGIWSSLTLLDNVEVYYDSPYIAFDKANVLHLTYGLFFGELMYQEQARQQPADTKTVSQIVQIPGKMTTPVLSFMYQLGGAYDTSGSSALVVEVDDGTTTTPILDITESSGPHWTHGWSDLSNWAGQTVTLIFKLEQAANAPKAWARVDEVTLGSGYPDLWSALGSGNGLPGQEVTVALTYGNQGGVSADGVHITQTLPSELSFVSASVTPISTSPLVWDVGDIPAGSNPQTILVTLKINNAAPPLVNLTSSIDISPTGLELETANNSSQGQIYTGLLVYMPVLRR